MPTNNTSQTSVLVPSYNHAAFIERCLRSIIKQTRAPNKLIVIDDGSSDSSPAIIERILKDCEFPAELIANSNRGLCSSLNEGFSKTDGQYFAYIGSDDIWLPTFLEAREDLLDGRSSAVLAYGHAHLIDENDNVLESTQDWKNFEFPDGDPRPMLYMGTAPVSSTVVYRRSSIESQRWNEHAKLEDYEMYLGLAEAGEFAFDSTVRAAWRVHQYNTSRDLDFMLNECLAAQQRVAEKYDWQEAKLRSVQKKTRFFYGEEFERKGSKKRAAALILQNLDGAPSPKILARALGRLIIPRAFIRGRRNANRARSKEKYGVAKV